MNGNRLLAKRKEYGAGRVEYLGLEFMEGGVPKVEVRHASLQLWEEGRTRCRDESVAPNVVRAEGQLCYLTSNRRGKERK